MSDKPKPRALPHVVFYTKPGCHLCEEAAGEIHAAGCADQYRFEKVNIEMDAELIRRYGWEIPVITINGIVTFKHRLTAAEFRQAIEKANDSRG